MAVTSRCLSCRSTARRYELDAAGRPLARRDAARRPRPDRDEDRLRRGPLRRLHGAARRRAGLSCITLAHTVGDREVTTIEGLREHPLVDAFVRSRRAPVRVLHARPDRLRLGARREQSAARAPRRSGTRWPATSAAAARIRRSRRRSPRGKADPHREGGRGPLRGGLARRRGGRARAVAGGPARDRRAARDAGDRAAARARRGALHRRPPAAGDAPRGGSPLPARARAREEDRRSSGRSTRRACARRSAPATSTRSTDEPGYQGEAVAAVAADTSSRRGPRSS